MTSSPAWPPHVQHDQLCYHQCPVINPELPFPSPLPYLIQAREPPLENQEIAYLYTIIGQFLLQNPSPDHIQIQYKNMTLHYIRTQVFRFTGLRNGIWCFSVKNVLLHNFPAKTIQDS